MEIRIHYEGHGEQILQEFVLPAVSAAIQYDRLTGYFSLQALLAISQGIESLWRRAGRMRVILGVHDVPVDLMRAALVPEQAWADEVVSSVRLRLLAEVSTLRDELARNQIATLAWMIEDRLLETRVAVPTFRLAHSGGIFHPKRLIFRDKSGDLVTAVGSPNETVPGMGDNYEELTVHMSWLDAQGYVAEHVDSFERLWQNRRPELVVRELDPQFARDLLERLGNPARPAHRLSNPEPSIAHEVLDVARRCTSMLPINVGSVGLYPHQERTLLDAVSRRHVRVLLADEVGLGKTLEAGAVISHALRAGLARRVLLLAPRSLLRQWQDEMWTHFGLNLWRFESDSATYVSARGEVQPRGRRDDVYGPHAPPLLAVSAQLARGTRNDGHLFARTSARPDLLLVDEAHAARLKPDANGRLHPTRLWTMLNEVRNEIRHLVLVTATPLQLHAEEYHAVLGLLGLPAAWSDFQKYRASLEILSASNERPSLDTVFVALRLIRSALDEMNPALDGLSQGEQTVLEFAGRSTVGPREAVAAVASWDSVYSLLVRTHPAHLLTIRNSRASLAGYGYRFPKRRLEAPDLDVPPALRELYERVDQYVKDAYGQTEEAAQGGRAANLAYAKSSYQQRLASSLRSCTLSLRRRLLKIEALARGAVASARHEDPGDLDEDESLENPGQAEVEKRKAMVEQAVQTEKAYLTDLLGIVERFSSDPMNDPKMRALVRLVDSHLDRDRILVFSRYTDTVAACLDAFRAASTHPAVGVGLYTGPESWVDLGHGPQPVSKEGVRRALDDGSISIVFCSDAASEGLNLQAARVVINVDVPWNPARLEQRIGRVDRLGQRAAEVQVYNLWYPNSIEARMYSRLLQRQDLYQLAVGEFPDVVSGAIREDLAARFQDGIDVIARDPLETLRELRDEAQHRAMQRVWNRDVEELPGSREIRRALVDLVMELSATKGWQVTRRGRDVTVVSPEFRTTLTDEPGHEDSISLRHEVWDRLIATPASVNGAETAELGVLESGSSAIAFCLRIEDRYLVLGPESVTDVIAAAVRLRPLARSGSGIELHSLSQPDVTAALANLRWLPRPEALTVPIASAVAADTLIFEVRPIGRIWVAA